MAHYAARPLDSFSSTRQCPYCVDGALVRPRKYGLGLCAMRATSVYEALTLGRAHVEANAPLYLRDYERWTHGRAEHARCPVCLGCARDVPMCIMPEVNEGLAHERVAAAMLGAVRGHVVYMTASRAWAIEALRALSAAYVRAIEAAPSALLLLDPAMMTAWVNTTAKLERDLLGR